MTKTFILIAVYFFMFSAVLAQTTPAPELLPSRQTVPFSSQALPSPPTEYTLLAPIPLNGPGSGESETTNAATFLPGLFKLMIGIATALAVIMLIFGGIKYMSTDAIGGKSDARATIENAIWGLLLAISAWLILYTINPKLVEFNLNIPVQEITTALPGGNIPEAGNCQNCTTISVPHKEAPLGCAAPGPCMIAPSLNSKLVQLQSIGQKFTVTESYPPTVQHEDPCHNSGTCVDISIPVNSTKNVRAFVLEAQRVGLNAVFEVTSQNRYVEMTKAGVPSTNIIINAKAKGEHFHVK